MSSVRLSGNVGGTGVFTVTSPNSNNSPTMTLPEATTTLVGTDATQTLTNKTLGTGLVMAASAITSGTSQASTSGTSIDFTGIPSWAKRVTLMLSAVSTSGSSPLRIQIGGGSLTTSGYVGCTAAIVSGTAGSTSFAGGGWDFNESPGPSSSRTGAITIVNLTGNQWVMQGTYGDPGSSGRTNFGVGSVSIASTLDRLRVTTVGGTDTFDAGTINILYE